MAELKTKQNRASVRGFLDAIEDDAKRTDAKTIHKLMRAVTGERAAMWGESIVGYGRCHMVYETGRELDWFLCGFSPRKRNLVLYVMPGFSGYEPLLARLGKYKTGKSCLYLNKLADVDLDALRELVEASVASMRARYPS